MLYAYTCIPEVKFILDKYGFVPMGTNVDYIPICKITREITNFLAFSINLTKYQDSFLVDVLHVLRNKKNTWSHDFGDGQGLVLARRHVNPDGSIGGWVSYTAMVAPTVYVGEDAQVYGSAQVNGTVELLHNVRVYGSAYVHANALLYHDAKVFDRAEVFGNACVYGHSNVYDHALIRDCVQVYGHAQVYGKVLLADSCKVHSDAEIFDEAQVYEYAEIGKGAKIGGKAHVKDTVYLENITMLS